MWCVSVGMGEGWSDWFPLFFFFLSFLFSFFFFPFLCFTGTFDVDLFSRPHLLVLSDGGSSSFCV